MSESVLDLSPKPKNHLEPMAVLGTQADSLVIGPMTEHLI